MIGWALCSGCRPSSADRSTSATTQEWFKDVTAECRLNFVHHTGTNYLMPQQVGSGAALLDYDGDGRLDVLLIQNAPQGSPPAKNVLFHQEPNGTFRDVSAGSGLDVSGAGMGVAIGDLNNDGIPDVVLTEYLRCRVFQGSRSGVFQELGTASGVDNPAWATAVSFLDYDRDGRLDLVIGNYLDYDPNQRCLDSRGERDFCAPKAFGSTLTRLWHNTTSSPGGTIHFEEVTEKARLHRAKGAVMGLVCADFDGDHWPDIFCADDGRPNRLYLNRRDGTFSEEAIARGLAFNSMGQVAANMGTVFADLDGDGWSDLFVTHLSEEAHGLWRPHSPGLYEDRALASGLQNQAWRGTGFGVVAGDFDLDGDLDLAFVNGLVRHALPAQTPLAPGTDPFWGRYAQRPQLFENNGAGVFSDVSKIHSDFCGWASVGRSLTVGDLNNDGRLDLIVSSIAGPVRLYRGQYSSASHHWLKVALIEPRYGNRDAIGAEARIVSGDRSFVRLLQPAQSYLCSSDPTVHVGLGTRDRYDSIDVFWPDGTQERFPGGKSDQTIRLEHGKGAAP